MTALGLPDFGPVQANVAWNAARGTTRGLHAEPWDKLVTVASGARVRRVGRPARRRRLRHDVRRRRSSPGWRCSCPRGVGNGYQTLGRRDGVHLPGQRPLASRRAVRRGRPRRSRAGDRLADPAGRAGALRARTAPPRAWPTSTPVPVRGAAGARRRRPGRAGRCRGPPRRPWASTRAELDLTDADALERWPWRDHDVVLNAAAYTAVDAAETADGRVGRVGGQRRGAGGPGRGWRRGTASRSCTSRPTTSTTAPAPSTTRTSRWPRSASTASRRPPATSRSPRRPALPPPHLVGGRRRRQLRAHHGPPGRRAALSPSVVADQVGRLTLRRRDRARPPGTCSTSARRTAPTT